MSFASEFGIGEMLLSDNELRKVMDGVGRVEAEMRLRLEVLVASLGFESRSGRFGKF